MEIETLLEIGKEIRDTISAFIRKNEDFGEIIVKRPKDITRKMDMAAENALDKALLSRGLSARKTWRRRSLRADREKARSLGPA